ncbi:DUF3352 domain-containing protein [Miltoncostaea oceani]|uniref:DUF3352 domain-containing protein n=1 Tax=Miltoncostaea oceani TaxID=2843216 RepID=UPI001C3D333C|nr:DUF3352 domain-containing protein [Miltoncostaea oceani]
MAVQILERLRRHRPVILMTSAVAGAAIAVSGCGGDAEPSTGAAAGEIASYVPAGSPVYVEATTDFDGPQWTQVDALAKLFPAYPELRAQIEESLRGEDVDFETEVKPLLGERAAIAGLDLPDAGEVQGSITSGQPGAAAAAADDTEFVGVVEIADGQEAALEALLVKEGATAAGERDGARLYTDDDTALAVADGVLIVSDTPEQVALALDAHAAGGDKTLGGTEKFTEALAKLPADVFGQAYIDIGALVQAAGNENPQVAQLGLADYQNAVMAASLAAEPEGARVKGVVMGVPDPGTASFSPTLTDKAPADAIAYLGFSDLSNTVTTTLDQIRASQSEEARSQIDAVGGQLPALLGVTLDDLSALTSGEHAIVVTSGDPDPGAVLALKVEDGARATQTLDALRAGVPQLLRTFSPDTTLPQWQQVPLAAGVQGWRLPLSPEAGVVYGVDGDLALIGTSVPAVTAVQRPTAPLSGSDDYRAAVSGMPDEVTSVMFVNIEQAIAAARKLGALEDAPAEALANLRPLKSLTAWSTGGDTPTFEVFLRVTG